MSLFLIIVILFGAAWLMFVLPARRRRMSHAAMQEDVVAGDEIITAGGIHGTVREVEGETVRVEIATGIVVTLDRRAIAAVASEEEVEIEPEPEPARDTEAQHESTGEPR